jgi:hypothetical protein
MASDIFHGRFYWITPSQVISRAVKIFRKCWLPLLAMVLSVQGLLVLGCVSEGWLKILFYGAAALTALLIEAASVKIAVHCSHEMELNVRACFLGSLTFNLPVMLFYCVIFYSIFHLLPALLYFSRPGLAVLIPAGIVFLYLYPRLLTVLLLAVPLGGEGKYWWSLNGFKISLGLARGNYLAIIFSLLFAGLLSSIVIAAIFAFHGSPFTDSFGVPELLHALRILDMGTLLRVGGTSLDAGSFLSLTAAGFIFNLTCGAIYSELTLNFRDEEMEAMARVFE